MSTDGDIKLELFSQLFDNSADLVLVRKVGGDTIFANRSAREFLGVNHTSADMDALVASRIEPVAPYPKSDLPDLYQIGHAERHGKFSIMEANKGSSQRCIFELEEKRIVLSDGLELQSCIYRDISNHVETLKRAANLREKLQERTSVMEALNKVAGELINRTNLTELLNIAARNAQRLTKADYCYIAMVHESGDYLETVAGTSDDEKLRSVRHQRGQGVAGETWASERTVISSDYSNYPNRVSGLTDIKQVGGVPVKMGKEVIGVFGVFYRNYEYNINEKMPVLEKIVSLVAVAIENTKAYEITQSKLEQTKALEELSRGIHSSTDLDLTLDSICVSILSAFDSYRVNIHRYDQERGFKYQASWEAQDGGYHPSEKYETKYANQSIRTWCLENETTVHLKRGSDDPRESKALKEHRKNLGIGSTVCVPLVHEGKPWGILTINRHIQQPNFSENDVTMLKIIGSHASIALYNRDLLHEIGNMAYRDSLTQLRNRYSFEDLVSSHIAVANNNANRIALLFIDLDGFKSVNDTHGHDTGDALLKEVAQRFEKSLTKNATLGRMGGDEFAVVIPDCNDRAEVELVARELLESVAREINIGSTSLKIGASIGICFYPDDADNYDLLMKNADIAMYSAKSAKRGTIQYFYQALADVYEKRLNMEGYLQTAIEENQFELYYQPKVCCSTRQSNTVEALIRWNHPEKGFIPPDVFIPIAEESDLIVHIGDWVIDEAIRQGRFFLEQGQPIAIAINISANQFVKTDFVETISGFLKKHRFPAQLLELELTESVVMNDVSAVVERLGQLRSMGIKIAIDDFGTGYSSLKYLEDFPLDMLKIDKAFVDKLDDSAAEESLVNTIVLMAKTFNLPTVAEGVETHEQLDSLISLGVDYVQGYLYSKPVPANELLVVMSHINGDGGSQQAA